MELDPALVHRVELRTMRSRSPFDTDDAEFARGVEVGRLWERLRGIEVRSHDPVLKPNALGGAAAYRDASVVRGPVSLCRHVVPERSLAVRGAFAR